MPSGTARWIAGRGAARIHNRAVVRNKVIAELAVDRSLARGQLSIKVARRLMGESANAYFDRMHEQSRLVPNDTIKHKAHSVGRTRSFKVIAVSNT